MSTSMADLKYKIESIDNQEVVTSSIVVHRFVISDVDDPDVWAADPLLQWQQSDAGQWVMKHAVVTPIWHKQLSFEIHGYQYVIVARLTQTDQTFFKLKFQ